MRALVPTPALGLTAAVTFAADQALKWFVVIGLDLANRFVVEVWPGLFTLTMAWNRGVNFGLMAGDSDLTRWALVALALAICAWVLGWARSESRNTAFQASAGLLVGGALGNVIDRIRWGAVADFLNVTCCGVENPWAFNIADVAIFVGAFGLILTAGRKKEA
jgi:signal peptidase II